MITDLADLQAALLDGGDVVCDPTAVIDVTGADVTASVPGTVLSGANLVASSGPGLLVSASDVTVRDPAIAGPGGTTLGTSQKLIYAVGAQSAPLSNVRVEGARLTGSMSDSVWLEWCVDSVVSRCAISDFLNSGVMVISGEGVAVDCNAIRDGHIPANGVEVYGIAVSDLANTVAARSRHCTVTGNRVHQIDWEGIDTHGGDGVVVTGNTVTASRRSIALVTGNATRVTAPRNCVVSGNLIDATGARVTPDIGIFLGGISGNPASATITGNQIVGYDGESPIVTTFWDRDDTVIANNSRPHVPWTNVTLTGGWTHNASFPLRYMVDGNTVTVRGGAIPPAGGIFSNPAVGTLANAAAWPSERTFYALTKAASGSAATSIARANVDTNGALHIDYAPSTATDQFTYWFDGTYQAV